MSSRSALAIAEEIAAPHHGILTVSRARAVGLTDAAIRYAVATDRWQSVHAGVLATTAAPLDWQARASAAVIATGRGARLSHRSAGHLHDLDASAPSLIDVSVPHTTRSGTRDLEGVAVHRRRVLPRLDPVNGAWPPRTSAAMTVIDVAAVGTADDAIAYAAKAVQRGVVRAVELTETLARYHRHPHRLALSSTLTDIADGAHSLFEVRWIERVERPHGLPAPTRQFALRVNGVMRHADAGYESEKLLIELDGRLGHEGDGVWRDLERDNSAALDGWMTLRYGWFDVHTRACAAAAQVAGVLTSRGWSGAPTSCGSRCAIT